MANFAHLRTHSEFSLKDGIMKLDDIIKNTQTDNSSSVALTDYNNMIATIKFFNKAKQNNIKPIVGCDIAVDDFAQSQSNNELSESNSNETNIEPRKHPYQMILLAKNNDGYKKLLKLVSRAHVENRVEDIPRLKKEWFSDFDDGSQGLIALSGGQFGEIEDYIRHNDLEGAEATANQYRAIFPDNFYLELHRDNNEYETQLVDGNVELSSRLNIPVVATHPTFFNNKEDFLAHEIKHCIANKTLLYDQKRPRYFNSEQHYKTKDQMNDMFSDLPEALENAYQISLQCNNEIELDNNYFPKFDTGDKSPKTLLQEQSRDGLIERFKQMFKDKQTMRNNWPKYFKRLKEELNIINNMGFPTYFLIVSDFINYAKNNNIPVGAGRGSGAGSLVAFSLGITGLDPIKNNLLFERFLNPARVSMPDFDVDFCIENREKVVDYVRQKYGEDAVSYIGTVNNLKAKAVVRDSVRVLHLPYMLGDKIARLIPNDPGITIDEALESSDQLKQMVENDKQIKNIIDLGKKIEGCPRHTGIGAAGVVISPTTVDDFTPLQISDGHAVSQYDKDDVEKAGLVKFDFLGINNLTIINNTVKKIKQDKNIDINIEQIKMDEPDVMQLYQNGNTKGIFQMESEGITNLAVQSSPQVFADIEALVALYRPGPLQAGMTNDYVKRKKGEQEVSYPHSKIESVLKDTYGVIVYQEQVMQIAQKLAGYSLGEADLLRRAMGKKKPEEMAKQKEFFVQGCVNSSDMDENKAEELFNQIEKFAGYAFNKSHSAAYALLSYQTAYLKTFYPAQYMSVLLDSDYDNTEKLAEFVKDAKQNNITINNPNVNQSGIKFNVVSDNEIEYSLAALKKIGVPITKKIVKARETYGEFTSFHDFCEKVGTGAQGVTKGVAESLIKSGAFDDLHPNRAALWANVEPTLELFKKAKAKNKKEQTKENKNEVLGEIFANKNTNNNDNNNDANQTLEMSLNLDPLPIDNDMDDWNVITQLEEEKKVLGFYVSQHPCDYYKQYYDNLDGFMAFNQVQEFETTKDSPVQGIFSGMVNKVIHTKTKKNQEPMGFLVLEDGEMEQKVVMFPKTYAELPETVKEGEFVAFDANIQPDYMDPSKNSLIANKVWAKQDLDQKLTQTINVALKREEMKDLEQVINNHKHSFDQPINQSYSNQQSSNQKSNQRTNNSSQAVLPITVWHPSKDGQSYTKVTLNDQSNVMVSEDLFNDLETTFGKNRIKVDFGNALNLKQNNNKKKLNKPR